MSTGDVHAVQESSPDPLEQTPLLASTDTARPWTSKFSVVSLAIPIAVAGRLAALLPMTPTIDLIHQIVCRMWYEAQDPKGMPSFAGVQDPNCSAPPVERYFSAIMTVVTAWGTIGGS